MGQETESRVPREAIEAAAHQLHAEHVRNVEAGYPDALGMGDRYAAERTLLAAYPLIREAVCQEIAAALREEAGAARARGESYWESAADFVESHAATTEESE